jgi:hypothetical protein
MNSPAEPALPTLKSLISKRKVNATLANKRILAGRLRFRRMNSSKRAGRRHKFFRAVRRSIAQHLK